MSVKPLTPLHMNTKKYGNSSFWLDKFDRDIDLDIDNEVKVRNNDLYKLAARKRAVSNFVSILTSKQIPVQFATNGDSYTDGNSVVISSKLAEPADFDVAVGLALHEASHIKLSSFDFLRGLMAHIYRLNDYHTLSSKSNELGIDLTSSLKNILNWVEDRRIDNFVFRTSPGYRDYYLALYDKYFNDKLIDLALKSDEHTDETFDSYMFRLINLQSKSTRLDALNGLRKISKIADLNNIGRITTTEEAFDVSLDIFREILNNCEANANGNEKQSGGDEEDENSTEGDENGSGSGNGNEGDGDETPNGSNGKSDVSGDGDGDEDGNSMEGNPNNSTSASNKSNGDVKLTDRQKEILKKKIEKQKDFINGDVKKTKISKSDAKSLKAIESSEAEMVEVGQSYQSNTHYHNAKSISCIFVKNMTKELMEDTSFPLVRFYYGDKGKLQLCEDSKSYVEAGIRLGTILGKRLQTHSESRDTVFNRQPVGKLDRRMVASLGFGNEQVFFTKETDKYNKANLHISIDASGSMGGEKWASTMTNLVALAKAVDMISTLEIQITFRTTSTDGNPYIIVGYDSRKDKFSKLKQLFPYLTPNGTTPEGLCFEAISKYMVGSSNNLDSYFLNISDGEPFFSHNGFYYMGQPAARHTKKMIDNMKKMGIRVLSYFVDGNSRMNPDSECGRIFKESYGEAARFIDVTSVGEVSKTMNRLFLQK